MKKVYLILAAAVGMTITSCTNNEYIGDVAKANLATAEGDGSIQFGFEMQNATRADVGGVAAADLLGSNFYVMGTKANMEATPAIPTNSPTTIPVFDNYLVHFGINTAGTTESNTANWEYVGIDQTIPTIADRVKLSSTTGAQTIKYWDYSASQYDFFAFSTGTYMAVKDKAIASVADDEINVTPMVYGASLASNGVAYTFGIPTIAALKNAFITDITEVAPGNYGKEVTLKFKNLGTKVRMALYETIPGYSVKDVVFYTVDGTTDLTDVSKSATAKLIGDDDNSFPTKGTIQVYFPHVGSANKSPLKEDYNKAAATVTAATGTTYDKYKTFGNLTAQLVAKERAEAGDDNVFLGRTLPTATFAGDKDAAFYETVFPISTSYPLTLRVDYTLVPIDGAAETIKVKGARAVVPSTYTKWLPNYAYTYIFKISDNTNGWTGTTGQSAGLFPITFDAVVTEATDFTDEQTTVTTVAMPTITTYQQNHNYTDPYKANEYKKSVGKDIYVQVMNNETSPATLVTTLNEVIPGEAPQKRSLLFAVSKAAATEAEVMDALENQYSNDGSVITGRNAIALTSNANIDPEVTEIINGVDDNPIPLTDAGKAAKIDISAIAAGTYAYVYDYSDAAKTNTIYYQQLTPTSGNPIGDAAKTYRYINISVLDNTATVTSEGEAVSSDQVYFSKTTNGSGTTTYSFVSVENKTTLPAGLIKISRSAFGDISGNNNASSTCLYFDTYTRNDGKYAVKVIKVVS